jgi:hypothetical protein
MEDPEGVYVVSMYANLFIVAQLVGIAVIVLATVIAVRTYVFGTTRRRRAFQCALAGREVEVEFAEHRIGGVVTHTTVLQCSAFESPTAITCARRCENRSVRRQWTVSHAPR